MVFMFTDLVVAYDVLYWSFTLFVWGMNYSHGECRLDFVNLFVIACFDGFVTTLCKVLKKIYVLILIL